MAEKTLPNLVVNRKEASEKIQTQIKKGKQFLEREIHSPEDLQQAHEDSYNWSRANTTLFRTYAIF